MPLAKWRGGTREEGSRLEENSDVGISLGVGIGWKDRKRRGRTVIKDGCKTTKALQGR